MTTETTEAPREEFDDGASENAVVRHLPVPAAQLAVAPQVEATELVARLKAIRDAQETAMIRDVDYGVVPGTDKPTLFKPGSEKLSVLFQLDVQLVNEKTWGPGDHLTVISHATVFHAPTGSRLGYGEGVCSTREKKYAKRQAQRTCPNCGEAAVIKGKADYGGGWLCWRKKGGCGTTWPDGAAEIESQDAGEVDNPDLPDLWNTVVKMGEKRARVDAVLAVTGASALFTQDLDDLVEREENGQGSQPQRQPARAQQPAGAKVPAATASKPKPQTKDPQLATPQQRKMIFAKYKEAGGDAENELRAIIVWITGQEHTDRIPKNQVDGVLKAIADPDGTLGDIHEAAEDAEAPHGAEARRIVDRWLKPKDDAPAQETIDGTAVEEEGS